MAEIPSPFKYPQAKHKRKLSSNYKTSKYNKRILREEFSGQCVYCRLPDFHKVESFGVDHYRPKERFPDLKFEYTNLFYACNACNSRKGASWPGTSQLKQGYFIPNPCDHIMFEHLKYVGIEVKARSKAGQYADEILDFNDDLSRKYRETVLFVIEKSFFDFQETGKTLSGLNALLDKTEDSRVVEEIEAERSGLAEKLENAKKRLKECGIEI